MSELHRAFERLRADVDELQAAAGQAPVRQGDERLPRTGGEDQFYYGQIVLVGPDWQEALVKRLLSFPNTNPDEWQFAEEYDCVAMLRNQWVEVGGLVRYEHVTFPGAGDEKLGQGEGYIGVVILPFYDDDEWYDQPDPEDLGEQITPDTPEFDDLTQCQAVLTIKVQGADFSGQIEIDPVDISGAGDGPSTSGPHEFERRYYTGAQVKLVAPESNFVRWSIEGGAVWPDDQTTIAVNLSADLTVIAEYSG